MILGWILFLPVIQAHAASLPVIYPYTISSGNPTASTATITWNTNTASNSTVNYGLTASYGTASTSASFVTSHSVTLTGLTANTTYHFDVVSTDSSSNATTSADYTFTTVVSCSYYVDSVSGNDANAGTDASIPLQHLNSVPAVSNGATICLRRGSTFKDTLYVGIVGVTSPINNVIVRDYGPANLPMPLVDNGDTIPANAWTAVGGSYPNLYQATVTGPGASISTPYGTVTNVSASTYVNVWECKSSPCTPTGAGGNDTYLQTANDQTTANSTAGSYFITGENNNGSSGPTSLNSFTIYMRTSDGTNPASSGYTYSYSSRETGIWIYGNNSTVSNIMVRKSAGNGGGFGGGPDGSNATYNNIESDQMGKHNILCSGGCTVSNSKFIDEYYPGAGNMFVAFDQNGSGLPITLNNDIFLNGVTTTGNSISPTFGHVGSGPVFSNFYVNGGLFEGINGALWNSGVSMSTNKTVVGGVTCINIEGCIYTYSTTTVANTFDASPVNNSATGLLSVGVTGVPISVASSTLCDAVAYAHDGVNGTGNAVTVASSTFYFLGGTGGATGVAFGGAGSSLNLYNTLMDAFANVFDGWVYDSTGTSTSPYSGDNNTFVLGSSQMTSGTVSSAGYNSLSAWKAGTGQDTHSTNTSPTPSAQTIACTLHQLSFTGPSSGTVNASSTNFTVTPSVGYNSVGSLIGYVGTVTVTPSGTAAAGLNPITLTFPVSASTTAQTFTILPTATGTITLSESANGATTSPTFLASTTLTYSSNIFIPTAPLYPSATAGDGTATVTFSAPFSIGGSPITQYTVIPNPAGGVDSNAGSAALTHTITGLTNGTSYTFTVTANNGAGPSAASAASNSVTPAVVVVPSTPSSSSSSGSSSGGSVSAGTAAYSTWLSLLPDWYKKQVNGQNAPNAPVPAPAPAPAPSTANVSGSSSFSRSLQVGSTGSDVKALQIYLNTHGYMITATGAGSPGHETTSFGSLTKKAVMKYQKDHGLPASGFFGPMTRQTIAK